MHVNRKNRTIIMNNVTDKQMFKAGTETHVLLNV